MRTVEQGIVDDREASDRRRCGAGDGRDADGSALPDDGVGISRGRAGGHGLVWVQLGDADVARVLKPGDVVPALLGHRGLLLPATQGRKLGVHVGHESCRVALVLAVRIDRPTCKNMIGRRVPGQHLDAVWRHGRVWREPFALALVGLRHLGEAVALRPLAALDLADILGQRQIAELDPLGARILVGGAEEERDRLLGECHQ